VLIKTSTTKSCQALPKSRIKLDIKELNEKKKRKGGYVLKKILFSKQRNLKLILVGTLSLSLIKLMLKRIKKTK
jgi:hypothetical protein